MGLKGFCGLRKLLRRVNLLEMVAQNEQIFTDKLTALWLKHGVHASDESPLECRRATFQA